MVEKLIPFAISAVTSLVSSKGSSSGRNERLQAIQAAEARRVEQEKALITQEQNAASAQTETNIANARLLKFDRGASKLLQFSGTGEGGVPQKTTLG